MSIYPIYPQAEIHRPSPMMARPYKYMSVVFVPPLISDLVRLAGVKEIHDLFKPENVKKISIDDMAFLIAFNDAVSERLGLHGVFGEQSIRCDDIAIKPAIALSRADALKNRIEDSFFHVDNWSPKDDEGNPLIARGQIYDSVESSVCYVTVYPGALTTKFTQTGEKASIDQTTYTLQQVFDKTRSQKLAIIRAALKPFNRFNSKEAIAMYNPSELFKAYLNLLKTM